MCRIKAYLWNYLIWHLWFTGWLLIIWKQERQKDCVWYFVEWFLMTLGRVKKFFVCFSNVFFEINADPFWHFFPHWHLLLHILHEIMQIYKETKISEWLHHVYLYLSLLCRSNLSLSLGLSVPRSFICKPLSLLINYWWQIVELLANQKLLWKNGEVVGGVNHCQAIKGQIRWCVMGYSMH